ncbi:MAG TPA: hypothetical protein VGM75_26475 [Pseudonocardiaceae bacterium]
MSISVDGFLVERDVSTEHPMGVGGQVLHEWLFSEVDSALSEEMVASIGATAIGRRIYDVGVEE